MRFNSTHHDRFAKYVELHGLVCQECGGSGGEIEPVLDYGEGPFIECGFCEGTGKTTPWLRGLWLRLKKDEKHAKLITQPPAAPHPEQPRGPTQEPEQHPR